MTANAYFRLQIQTMRIYFAIAGWLLLASCNQENRAVTVVEDEAGAKPVITPESEKDLPPQFQTIMEDLQKLPPYTQEEMKALLPEALNGAMRSNVNVTGMMGTTYASADYEINDSAAVSLKLLDCAGEAGAGIYSIQFLSALNSGQEDDESITRTIQLGGEKAIEHIEKDGSEATLMWLFRGRVMATLEGTNLDIEIIKELATRLK